jgi:hypothetical protein
MRLPRGLALAGLVLVLGISVSTLVASAAASGLLRPPPGSPDPKLMVLKSSDLGGAKVKTQLYYMDSDFPSVISYGREFDSGKTRGVRLAYVQSQAEVGASAATSASFLAYVRRLLGSKTGRADVAKGFARGVGDADVFVSELKVGRPRNLGVGPGSFDLPMSVKVFGLPTDLHFAIFRVERVLGALVTVGKPGTRVPLSAMTRLARLMTGRMAARLGPKNIGLPVVAGAPQVGQTLTSTTGGWTGTPTSFSYQWQRCDSGGANCADVPAANSRDYVLTSADAGFTIRVSVTAGNGFGTATAQSAPTGVVLASQAPANSSLPTISGVAQVGQTLTGTTGSWTGAPTSFAFQWQRCDSGGANCVDISGTSSGIYTVGSGDVGSTIRVTVTATNAFGSTRAVSLPTSVVS